MKKTTNESDQIFNAVEKIKRKYHEPKWKKFIGDCVTQVFKNFIEKSLPPEYKVVGPNVYIKGLPVEYDLLIIKRGYGRIKHTNAYPAESIMCVIEVKAKGLFFKVDEATKIIGRVKDTFAMANAAQPQALCIYITYSDVKQPKRRTSIKYFDLTSEFLNPYKAYCLRESRKDVFFPEEWQKFIENILNHLNKQAAKM